jgi:hypothetical protein
VKDYEESPLQQCEWGSQSSSSWEPDLIFEEMAVQDERRSSSYS